MKAVNNVLTSFVKFCYVYGNFKKSIKVAHLQKLANQAMMNGALVIEMTKWLFNEARSVLIEKILDFAIYLSYSECAKEQES